MSKLYILKQWLSLEEACEIASEIVQYNICVKDLINLWSENQLECFYLQSSENNQYGMRRVALLPRYSDIKNEHSWDDCVCRTFFTELIEEGQSIKSLLDIGNFLQPVEVSKIKIKCYKVDEHISVKNCFIVTHEESYRYLMELESYSRRKLNYDFEYENYLVQSCDHLRVNNIFYKYFYQDDFNEVSKIIEQLNDSSYDYTSALNEDTTQEDKLKYVVEQNLKYEVVLNRQEFIQDIKKLTSKDTKSHTESSDTDISQIEKLHRMVAALSIGFVHLDKRYNFSGKPNATRIGEYVESVMKEIPQFNSSKYSSETIRKAIGEKDIQGIIQKILDES